MDQICGLLQRLQRDIQDNVTSTQLSAPEHLYAPQLIQINDSVYSLHCPPEGKRPSVEIVLFHGLQLEGSRDAYITSWVSRSQSNPELWVKWILEDEKLEDARILLISYDAHVRRTNEEGRMDMHNTSENLMLDLIDNAQVGQDGCPVILVGHCLGGLLMKELCVQAQVRVGVRWQDNISRREQNFLDNVQGFFCYGTPHHGTELANISTFSKGPLFKDLTTLNNESARRNENFRTLRQQYKWRTFGVGETVKANLGRFQDLVVEEASARLDVDEYRTEAADHFNVCRPQSRKSSIFLMLKNFVSDVVEKDKSRQGPTMKISDFGLEPQINEIRHKLFNRGVQRLGIVGMGGIGKTTLAKVVFNAIRESFDYTCFLMEVKKKNPDSLQDEIKRSLCFRGRPVSNTFEWSDLKGKRVLIVLDDITDESHVQVITEDENFLSSKNCTVIVTARDSGFLSPEDFECHPVRELDNENSEKLFCKYAFKEAKPQYEDLVEAFLEKCDGLPLAIEVAGKYVYRKSEKIWSESLKKLGSHPLRGNVTDKLTSILNMSYDDLAEIEQEIFLDVAHCFHGQRLSTVKQAWQICGCEGYESGWKNLLDKGLVMEVTEPKWWEYAEGESRFVIQMHELLRDLGLSKPCPDPQTGSGTSQGNPPILEIGVNKMPIVIFEEAGNLRNLFFDNGRLSGVGPHTSKFLKVKHLHRWISSCFRSWREAVQTLEIMECKYLVFLPKSLGQLQSLEHLKIVNCADLQAVPESVGLLSNLKDLTIQDCGSLSALPESLGDLKGLQRLVIHECGSLVTLPESLWRLGVLEYLAIEGCHSLEALPLSLGQLPALKELKISECFHLQTLPRTIWGLQALQHLTIQECRDLKALPKSLGKLRVLEYLTIEKCNGLETLPLSIGELPALKHLKISDCRSLHTLPASIPLLPALQRLTVRECPHLESLPKSLGQLRSLQHLTLEGCWNLVSLPESLWQLRGLRQLTIKCCHVLKSLLWTFGVLQDLERVTIQECESLQFLPFGWPGALEEQPGCHVTIDGCPIEDLQALKHLTIQCRNLEHLPMSIGNLQHLEHLTIQECQCLQDLPESIQKLGALTKLTIQECPSLEHLPENIGGHKALKHLTIQRCQNLKELPKSIGDLRALEHLTIQECLKLEELPDKLMSLQTLEHLTIQGCENLKAFPWLDWYFATSEDMMDWPKNMMYQWNLPALKHLTIQECQSLEHLPQNFGRLESLEFLTIKQCQNLKELPDSVGHLRSLQHLTIEWCHSLVALPQSLGRLPGVRQLTINFCQGVEFYLKGLKHVATQECERLSFLPFGCTVTIDRCPLEGCPTEQHPISLPMHFPALEDLTMQECQDLLLRKVHFECKYDCQGFKPVPMSISNIAYTIRDCVELTGLIEPNRELRALTMLVIWDCDNLHHLPDGVGLLRTLEHLTIDMCQDLKELPASIGDLGALKCLIIKRCESLEYLPDTLGLLRTLEHLTISHLNLKELPASIGDLRALQHLTIERCECFKDLPESIEKLGALTNLAIQDCDNLSHLPDGVGLLRSLEHLTIERCKNLKELPASIGDVGALKYLIIEECKSLEYLPKNLGQLQNLEHLMIRWCENLKELPASIGDLRALKHLTIVGCVSLEYLPDTLGLLRTLEHLTIRHLNLKELPASIGDLRALKYLIINWCFSSEYLPDTLGLLRTLEHLTISDLTLKELPASIGDLRALKHLTIQQCLLLDHLPKSIGNLRALEHLTIAGCSTLRSLPESITDLLALKRLSIQDCRSLERQSLIAARQLIAALQIIAAR